MLKLPARSGVLRDVPYNRRVNQGGVMDLLKRLDPLWIALLIIGGLNWAVLALFDTNVVSEIFGTGTVADAIYVLVGVAALMLVPRLLEGLHVPGRHTRPHG